MDKENRGIPDAKALFTIYGRGSANSRRIYSPTSIIRTPIIWTIRLSGLSSLVPFFYEY